MSLVIPIRGMDRQARRGGVRLKPVEPSPRVEAWYFDQLVGLTDDLKAFGKRIAADLRGRVPAPKDSRGAGAARDGLARLALVGGAPGLAVVGGEGAGGGGRAVDAAPPKDVKKTLQRGRAEAKVRAEGAGAEVAVEFSDRSLEHVDKELAASVEETVGVDIRAALKTDPEIAAEMADAVSDNVDLITSIPEEYFDELGDIITEAWDAGLAPADLADLIEALGESTEERVALIARDQTAKLNSRFNEVRQTSIGIERYEWQTAEDDRVRESHADLDGKVFSWDDPPIVDGEAAHPGEPINCRCVASPVVDADEEQAVEEAAAEDGYWYEPYREAA